MTQRSAHLRRLPLVAVLALVGLSACGDAGPAASDPTVTPVADGLRPPTPIRYSNAGSGGVATAAGAAEADGRMATDQLIAPTYVAEFVAAEGLVLPTQATGWVYDAAGTGSAELAGRLAAQFGVTGEAVRVDDWEPGGWQIGPTDGSGDSFFLADDAQLSWSFSPRWNPVDAGASVGCEVPPYDPDTDAAPPTVDVEACVAETVPPPSGVPTAAEAEQRARDLLEALGVDAAGLSFDVYADEWSASVSASEPIEGLAEGASTGRSWSFGFGADGVLTWAGGVAAAPAPVGPYELIGLDAALARLSRYQFNVGMPVSDLARSAGVAEPAIDIAAPDASTSFPAGDDAPVADEMPLSIPAPEPVTVTLVDVQPDVWWVWDADYSVWVVPAYRFIGDDGGWYTVPAVSDDYLILVDPAPVDTIVPDTAVAPVPTDAPTPTDPAQPEPPATTAPEVTVPDTSSDTPEPTTPPAPVAEGPDFADLVGTTLDEFSAAAAERGFTTRVTEIDGEPQPVTMDFRSDRVNVAVTTQPDGSQLVVAVNNIG